MVIDTQSKVENFIQSLELPQIAEVLLKTVEDCQLFYISFYGRNRYIIDDLFDYREHKISKENASFESFIENCIRVGLKEGMELTFLQSFSEDDMELIIDALSFNKLTLVTLFEDFQKNINKSIMKNVL